MKIPGLVNFRLCELSNEQLMEAVSEALNKMYETGKIPSRHIPARPDEDFDLLVGELLVRFSELQPKEQICYKTNEKCHFDCAGLCKESC